MKILGIVVAVLLVIGGLWFLLFSDNTDVVDDFTNDDNEVVNTDDGGTLSNDTGFSGNANPNNSVSTADYVLLSENEAGDTVTVAAARLNEDGYIVLYRTGSDGQVTEIGSSELLTAGTYTNIEIETDLSVSDEDSVSAVLFADTDGNGVFSIEDGDTFITNVNSNIVGDIDVIGVDFEDEQAELLEQAEDVLERELENENEQSA